MTTHPKVVQLAGQAINLLLGRKITIKTPFENLTKAEVVAISPMKPAIKLTHSCITQSGDSDEVDQHSAVMPISVPG